MSTSVQQAIASLPVPGEWMWQVVVRPRRRTLGIEVSPGGEVLFAVPADADPGAVAEAVRMRLPRLAEEVRRRRGRAAEPVKELVGGTGFAYLGRNYRLKPVPDEAGRRVRLHRGWLELPRSDRPEDAARLLSDWYTRLGEGWLAARMPPLAQRVGVRPEGVTVGDLGPRWAALDRDGLITVHWAVMQLPPALVDLVLVHELCHLRVPGHGAAFRRQVRLALPDADHQVRWFEEQEPLLWRGAVL
ncbi:M48 family metallopeptidase [Streptomyces albireticuli]|uniref:M48 family metallopeptidase n=1 Tax=Streptomyces albireticuli TaxID=1940 RepID=UPI003692B502